MEHYLRVSEDRSSVDFVTDASQGALFLVARGRASLDESGEIDHIVNSTAAIEESRPNLAAADGWVPVPPMHRLSVLGISALSSLGAQVGKSGGASISNVPKTTALQIAAAASTAAPAVNSRNLKGTGQVGNRAPNKFEIDLEVVIGSEKSQAVVMFRGKEYIIYLTEDAPTQG